MLSRADVRSYAGQLAACNLAVAKQIPLREPLFPGGRSRFHPSSVRELPRLLEGDDTPARRLARRSAAALIYSVDKRTATPAARLLTAAERPVLSAFHDARKYRDRFGVDRSCAHCRLLFGTTYGSDGAQIPPFAVLNHAARVNITFDPDTCIASAQISDFQTLLPQSVAERFITLSHPLRWATSGQRLFQRSDAVDRDGIPAAFMGLTQAGAETMWDDHAAGRLGGFIFEDVIWPVNEELTAASANIIRFSNLQRRGASFLEYDYVLQRSVRSNFGIAWEPGGLDIDGGSFSAEMVPLHHFTTSTAEKALGLELRQRDVLEMGAFCYPDNDEKLCAGWPAPAHEPEQPLPQEDVRQHIALLADRLQSAWPALGPYAILSVSASKTLHFTIPENGPIELWHLLTFTAPSILFMFLNTAICHAPHLLVQEKLDTIAKTGVIDGWQLSS